MSKKKKRDRNDEMGPFDLGPRLVIRAGGFGILAVAVAGLLATVRWIDAGHLPFLPFLVSS